MHAMRENKFNFITKKSLFASSYTIAHDATSLSNSSISQTKGVLTLVINPSSRSTRLGPTTYNKMQVSGSNRSHRGQDHDLYV